MIRVSEKYGVSPVATCLRRTSQSYSISVSKSTIMLYHLTHSAMLSYCFRCREVVASLIEEYKACESADYINWGMSGGGGAAAGAGAGAGAAQGGKEPAAEI